MIVEDFILLGRTVPEKSKKYDTTVCAAGYSKELNQLMRVYPLPPTLPTFRSRTVFSIALERNNLDSRMESWTLKNRSAESIKNSFMTIGSEQLVNYLEKHRSESIQELNKKKRSLGVLKISDFKVVLKTRKQVRNQFQMELFDDFQESCSFKTAGDYFLAPYLDFSDSSRHSLQIREWGVYELLRKYDSDRRMITANDIGAALNLKPSKDLYLLVGNMAHARNTWLIIKTFSFSRQVQKLLFD